jgi:uncharacterized membrane protein
MREPEGAKSSTGLDTRTAGLLTYILGFITGIIFLTIEKDSRFVKFHAMQSILISASLLVINLVLGMIPVIGWIVGILLVPLSFILWIACMLLALQGKLFKLPVVGDIAERQIRQM